MIKLITEFCIIFFLNTPIAEIDYNYCEETIIDCYYDDIFTVEQCTKEFTND